MSIVMNLACSVETTLLNKSLATSISAVNVAFTRVVSAVATHNKLRAVAFLLLSTHIANKFSIHYIFSSCRRHTLLANEFDCICLLDAPSDTVHESTKLVGGRLAPLLLVLWILH